MENLFNKDKYLEFYPKKDMSKIDKAYAIIRFAIYYGIIICVFNLDSKWLAISILLYILITCSLINIFIKVFNP